MIGSLVRLLGLDGTPRASAPRFAPQLEVLDGRTMPSVVVGGFDSPQDQFSLNGTRRPGEEVPALSGGGVAVTPQDQYSLNGTRRPGEEVPALLNKATPILFRAHIGDELPQ